MHRLVLKQKGAGSFAQIKALVDRPIGVRPRDAATICQVLE
jgi:hypothetical protein